MRGEVYTLSGWPNPGEVWASRRIMHAMSEARLLFDAEPMAHPQVLDAHKQAVRALKRARIPFRETGGIALNMNRLSSGGAVRSPSPDVFDHFSENFDHFLPTPFRLRELPAEK